MVLRAGDSYTASNKKTKVIQGALTGEQTAWWWDNGDKPIDEITHLTLDPAQKLYIFLCQNGFKLQEALKSCDLTDEQKLEAQQALNILDNEGNLQNINGDGVVTKVTRPSFVGADLRGAQMRGADLQYADLQYADLQEANLQGADLRKADLWYADLRGAQMRGADLRGADLWKANLREANLREADLQGANLRGADLREADLESAFYCQDNPPKNLEDALSGVDAKQHPMALTSQEYENVCRLIADKKLMPLLRDSGGHLRKELDRLRDVCDTRIDSQQQVDTAVNAAKAKFGCSQSFPTPVAIMFSQGFDAPTRAAWYGNGTVGKVLQVISHGLESLNHLVGRGSR